MEKHLTQFAVNQQLCLLLTRSMLAKEPKAWRSKRGRLVLILRRVYLLIFRPSHAAKFRMRRLNGRKRLDWRFLISPITVKRHWGGGKRHVGTEHGLEGGGWSGGAEERDYAQEENAELLIP